MKKGTHLILASLILAALTATLVNVGNDNNSIKGAQPENLLASNPSLEAHLKSTIEKGDEQLSQVIESLGLDKNATEASRPAPDLSATKKVKELINQGKIYGYISSQKVELGYECAQYAQPVRNVMANYANGSAVTTEELNYLNRTINFLSYVCSSKDFDNFYYLEYIGWLTSGPDLANQQITEFVKPNYITTR